MLPQRVAVPIVGVQCAVCSRFVPQRDIIRIGESVNRCQQCEELHLVALDKLAANPPRECGTCKTTWEQLKERAAGDHVSMFVHWKDGCYQVLCSACDLLYVPQRRDLYGKTRHGWDRKIK